MCVLSSNIKKHMIDAFGEKRHRLLLRNSANQQLVVLVHPFLISTRQKRTNFFSVREKRKNKRIMRKTTLYTFGYAGSFFMH